MFLTLLIKCFELAVKIIRALAFIFAGTGLDQKDLIIVGTDVVYSLTREKTVARFYTIQCTQPNMSHVIDIPIKDVVDRFHSSPTSMYLSTGFDIVFILYFIL